MAKLIKRYLALGVIWWSVLPMWLILQGMRPFMPATHPLKSFISLDHFSMWLKPQARIFGVIMWIGVIDMLYGCYMIFLGSSP